MELDVGRRVLGIEGRRTALLNYLIGVDLGIQLIRLGVSSAKLPRLTNPVLGTVKMCCIILGFLKTCNELLINKIRFSKKINKK